jgi:hypothetical protein
MKKTLTVLLYAASSLLVSAQSTPDITNDSIGFFRGIEAFEKVKILLKQGSTPSVRYQDTGEEVGLPDAEIKDNVLYLGLPKSGKNSKEVKFVVTIDSLNFIKLQDASSMQIDSVFHAGELNIRINSTSYFKGVVIATLLNLQASGASDITLSGRAEKTYLTASGSSDITADSLYSEKAEVNASGSSDVGVHVTKSLNANISGFSDLRYSGNPAEVTIDKTGTSDIVYNGDKLPAGKDTTRLRLGDSNILIFGDKKKNWKDRARIKNDFVWMGFDTGINGWVTAGGAPQAGGAYSFMKLNYPASWLFRWNVWEAKIPITKNKKITIVTGMGFEWNNYSFENKIILRENPLYQLDKSQPALVDIKDSTQNVLKSRLQTGYFSMPLMINFRTAKVKGKSPQLNITTGVIGSVLMDANERHVMAENGQRVREIRHDNFHLNKFRATAILKIRYSFLNLFGTYTFTPLFKDGPVVYPWTAGITIGL